MSLAKIKVGDTVQVMSGAERSLKVNRGKILSIDREANRVRVEGLRLVKRHIKKGRDRANPEGGIVESAGTIALSSPADQGKRTSAPLRYSAVLTRSRVSVTSSLEPSPSRVRQ